MSQIIAYKAATPKEEPKKAALAKYRKLYGLARTTMKQGDGPKLRKAFRLALTASEGAGVLHLTPPLEVAEIVAELALEVVPIICALLYNPVKGLAPTELQEAFGADVAQMIHRLAKLEAMAQAEEITNPLRACS